MKNMKIVKSLEDSGFLIKGVAQTIENQTKKQKGGFFSILLCTLGARLLGNMLASKGMIRWSKKKKSQRGWEVFLVGEGVKATRQGWGTIRAELDF